MTWDQYFFEICKVVGENSKCYSRKIGAIIVKDKAIISSGYNGPARGIPDCSIRYSRDEYLKKQLPAVPSGIAIYTCPRKALGYKSGEGLDICIASHSEENAIVQAARSGVSTRDATLYVNATPCLRCIQMCINAGIKEIVTTKIGLYNGQAEFVIKQADILMREFEL